MMWIRSLLIAAAALGLVSAAGPVAAASQPFTSFGFRAGVASSRLHGDFIEPLGSEARTGFAGAFYLRAPVGRWLSIQPELGWASKGDRGDISLVELYDPYYVPSPYDFNFERRMDYFEIPLLLHARVPGRSFFEPFITLGPEVSIRTGSSLKSDLTMPVSSRRPQAQPAAIFERVGTFTGPSTRSVVWGAIAGGGVAMGRGSLRLIIESRYALGLSGVFPHGSWSDAHTGAWISTLGIELR